MLTLLIPALVACHPGTHENPLARLDSRYIKLENALAIAERDTTRNVLNREARDRRVHHEQQEVAFFRDPRHIELITAARGSTDPAVAAKAEAYWRRAVFLRSWTDGEKARETELVAGIEARRDAATSWSSPDGKVEIPLSDRWPRASREADDLPLDQVESVASAWVANRLDWLGPEVQELVRLRNAVARREGFSNWWELSIYHRGLDVEQVERMNDAVEALLAPIHREQAARVAEVASREGIPWTFATTPMLRRKAGLEPDPRALDGLFDADLAEERVTAGFEDLGLSMEGVQIYAGPRRYTRPGAYSYALRPPGHIALVMSRDSRWGWWPYQALGHELGLVSWWRSLPQKAARSPVMWEPPEPWFEGIGQFFERMVSEPAWLERHVPELPPDKRQRLASIRRQQAVDILTRYLGCNRFERSLYEDPGDLAALTARAAERERKLRSWPWEAPRDEEGRTWSDSLDSGLMLAFPGYVQNYLFAYATEATLWEAAKRELGEPVGNPRLGQWIVSGLVEPVSAGTPFPDALAALAGGDTGTGPLERYLRQQEPAAP